MLQRFRYEALDGSGARASGVIEAEDDTAALRRLSAERLQVLRLEPGRQPHRATAARGAGLERIAVLRQLALLVGAGVELLEALETVAAGFAERPMGGQLLAVARALRRGDPLSIALPREAPGFPSYLQPLLAVGEASGRLDVVLAEAARELAAARALSRDILSALTYPLFLLGAGGLMLLFLFFVVAPQYADMLGARSANLDWSGQLVLAIGGAPPWLGPIALAGVVLLAIAAARRLTAPRGRQQLMLLLERLPVARDLVRAAQAARWARVLGFALTGGVGFLDAARLAQDALPPGAFQDSLSQADGALRSGQRIDEAFAAALTPIERSLLRAGQRSGALEQMLQEIAEMHEAQLREGLKRFGVLFEQAAIGAVTLLIALVVLTLVLALTSVYQAVQL